MKRIVICDIRPVISDPRAGVATYIVSQLPHIIETRGSAGFEIVFFSAGAKKIEVPESIRALMRKYNVSHTHVPVSNKLLTTSALTGVGMPYDAYVSKRRGAQVAEWLVLDPGPWHVSDSIHVSMLFHDLGLELFPNFFPRSWNVKRKLLFGKKRIDRIDSFLTVSENTKRELMSVYGVQPDRISVLPQPAFAHTSVSGSDMKERKRILFVSTISPRKNLIAALRVWERVANRYPNYSFDVVGAAGWKSKKEIGVMHSMRSQRVSYHGSISHAEKTKLLSEALVVLYPSLYEGLGIPPQEARAEGIPAIVSDETPLIRNAGEWGIACHPHDIQSVEDALVSVLDSYAYWKSKAARTA